MSDIELRYQREILDAVMDRVEVESRSEILPALDYILGMRPAPVKDFQWTDLPEAARQLWEKAKLAESLRKGLVKFREELNTLDTEDTINAYDVYSRLGDIIGGIK